jgi:multidrug efflux pump subunit AcrA (membrane-fusion protein)
MDLVQTQTPEQKELERKRAELARLESALTQEELTLATLKAELRAFEVRYLRIVGSRYADLDAIEAQIASAEAKLHPYDRHAQQRASDADAQARASADTVGSVQDPSESNRFMPSEELKSLYRKIARQIHPDLVTDEKERTRRHLVMAEVNSAYSCGDDERLRAILREWHSSPELITGEGPGAELVRVIRKIAQVEHRLSGIEIETAELKGSEVHQLWIKVKEGELLGRDVLAEMAEKADLDITKAQKRLEGLGGGTSDGR